MNLVYWGTGNAGGDFNDEDRLVPGAKGKEANLYTASVVALDADTGKLRWYHQEVPDDLWDFDSAYECVLIDRAINGRMRKLLVHMNKSGVTFVLDRVTGDFIGAFSMPELQTWISGITEDGKLVGRKEPETGKVVTTCPSAAGAKSWNGTAYSPRTGYVYAPINEVCNDLTSNVTEAAEGRFHANGGFTFKLPAGSKNIQSPGCLGSHHAEARLEHALSIHSAGFGTRDCGRSGVLRRSRGRVLRSRCAQWEQAVELSNRGGQSRIGGVLFRRRAAVHRHSDGLAASHHWCAACSAVSRTELACRFYIDRIRIAGGFEMRRLLLLLLIPALGRTQEFARHPQAWRAGVQPIVRDRVLSRRKRRGGWCAQIGRTRVRSSLCQQHGGARIAGYGDACVWIDAIARGLGCGGRICRDLERNREPFH